MDAAQLDKYKKEIEKANAERPKKPANGEVLSGDGFDMKIRDSIRDDNAVQYAKLEKDVIGGLVSEASVVEDIDGAIAELPLGKTGRIDIRQYNAKFQRRKSDDEVMSMDDSALNFVYQGSSGPLVFTPSPSLL